MIMLCFKILFAKSVTKEKQKHLFLLLTVTDKKIKSKFCTSEHFHPKAYQQCMLDDLVTNLPNSTHIDLAKLASQLQRDRAKVILNSFLLHPNMGLTNDKNTVICRSCV